MPSGFSKPIQSQRSSLLVLVEIATRRACDAKVYKPRTVIIVPSVVSSAPQPINPASTPLTAPISKPQPRLRPRTAQTGRPRMWKP